MPEKSTKSNQLIALMYNELTATKKADVLSVIQTDDEVKQEWLTLSETVQALNEISEEPSQSTIDLIMEYSAKTHEPQHA